MHEEQSFGTFKKSDLSEPQPTDKSNHYRKLFELRETDIRWKLKNRPRFGWTLTVLLLAQNIVVFGLLAYALLTGLVKDLNIALGIIIPATLAETAITVRTIVQWLFSDIDYAQQ